MTNTQFIQLLEQAKEDWSKFVKSGKASASTQSGLCAYFWLKHKLNMDFCYTYIYPFRVKLKGLNSFWFTLDREGAIERVKVLENAILHYTLNPLDDEQSTVIRPSQTRY